MVIGILITCSSTSMGQTFNKEYTISNFYRDNVVAKSTIEIYKNPLPKKIITVGSIKGTNTVLEDIVITHTDVSGNITWTKRYGKNNLHENASGVTQSQDGRHVIVTGLIMDPQTPNWRSNLLIMKIRILDGAVIWSRKYGTPTSSEVGILVGKVPNIEGDKGEYIIMGTSEFAATDSKKRLFGLRIDENGGIIWSKRYQHTSTSTKLLIPTDMQVFQNSFKVTGRLKEQSQPRKIFVVDFRTDSGDQYTYGSSDFFTFSRSGVDLNDPSLTSVSGNQGGTAIAYTSNEGGSGSFCFNGGPTNKVNVSLLDINNNLVWTKYFWQDANDGQRPIGIHSNLSTPKGHRLNVGVNTFRNGKSAPAFLSLDPISGGILGFRNYRVAGTSFENVDRLGNDMVPIRFNAGYLIKSRTSTGYNIIKADNLGYVSCSEEDVISTCGTYLFKGIKKVTPINYGTSDAIEVINNTIQSDEEDCQYYINWDGTFDAKSNQDQAVSESAQFVIHPNPADDYAVVDASDLNWESITVTVLDMLGQEVYSISNEKEATTKQYSIPTSTFESGAYMVVVKNSIGEMLTKKLIVQ